MRFYIPRLILSLIFFSCESKNDEKVKTEITQTSKEKSFEKLDSIQINYLGSPIVHDLNPVSKIVLFMENTESFQEIYLADFEGNLVNSFSKFGDMPDSYGKLLSTLRIQDDNTFLAYGFNGFLTYDFSGNLRSRVRLKKLKMLPFFSRKAMGYGMEKSGTRYIYTNQELPESISQSDTRFYEEMDLMIWLDPDSGDGEPFIKFPEISLFRNGKHFYRGAWEPVFTIEDDEMYVVFGAEPVIYVFSLNKPYSLITNMPIDLKDYRYFEGSDNNAIDFSLMFISGRILSVKKFDGYFIIAYFPGYSSEDKEAESENKSQEENLIFRERMLKKYAQRIAILDAKGNTVSDFVPKGLVPSSMLVRNGELWMLEKPNEEVEQDYFRLFRVGLKTEK